MKHNLVDLHFKKRGKKRSQFCTTKNSIIALTFYNVHCTAPKQFTFND